MVFDNYHEIAPDSPLHAALASACTEVPQSANVLVLSRAGPPPSFAEPLVNQVIAPVGWDDLRLTVAEAETIAVSRGMTDSAVARNLHIQTDGWIAGLTLMLERFKGGGVGRNAPRAESLETVFDYFGQVILERLPDEARGVLLRTALLPRITAALSELVTGLPNAIHHVDALHRRHLFTTRTAGATDSYEFHALFRAFLKTRAEATFTPEQRDEIRLLAARFLQKQGSPEDAFVLYMEASAWSEAELVLIAHARTLVAQGRLQTLQEWVRTLPEDRVKGNPWVRYWFGRSLILLNPIAAQQELETVFGAFVDLGEQTGQMLSAAAVLEALYFDFRQFRSMDPWIERLSQLIATDVNFPTREDELRVYSALMMGATYRAPEHPGFKNWIDRVKEMVQEPLDPNLRLSVANMLQAYGNMAGEMEIEQFVFGVAKPLLEAPQLTPWNAAFYLACEAHTYYLHGRYSEAFSRFDRADAIAGEHGLNDVQFKSGVWRALCARRAGMLDEAESTIRRIEALRDRRANSPAAPIEFLKACVAFDRGDFERAATGAVASIQECLDGGQYNAMMLVRLVCANILTGSGRLETAGELLQSLRNDVLGPVTAHYLGAVALNEAWIAHRKGEQKRRDELLHEALGWTRNKCARGRFRWYGNAMSELLPVALARGIEADIARGLVREFSVVPLPADIEDWPWPIRIYTLGRFELLIDGTAPGYSRKAPKKVLALLKAIVALGANEVPEQKLLDALWPDEDGDAARRSLTATLHRLRKLLGDAKAIRQTGGALTLNEQCCWIDKTAFEIRIDRATDADKIMEKAIALYGGPFLVQEEDVPWVVPARERLRAKYIYAVGKLGAGLEVAGRHENAIELYLRGIEADELVEPFYQGLMRCYDKLNRRTEAVSTYRRLRQTLSVSLGVQPSGTTQRLFEILRLN